MGSRRRLIVNADDFGQSPGVNRGVVAAHERGIVTSASLMVRWPASAEAAAHGRAHPELSLGLHLDLGEWMYREETWVPLYEVAPLDDRAALTEAVGRQLAAFRALVGRDPSHVDSHQHVHLREPLRSILLDAAAGLGVPLRHCSSRVRYCGDFYGQTAEGMPLPGRISVEALTGILAALAPGGTELGCHPGEGNDLTTMYTTERAQELAVLCDARVRARIAELGIELCSFRDLGPPGLASGA